MNAKPKILIIEDDIDMVESMKKILETRDYQIIIAYDPEEGNDKLIREKPDLIILDVMFGSKGETLGFDFARKLKHDKRFAQIPIMMLSAINAKEHYFHFSPETDGDFLPVDLFLDKPLQPDELFSKVEALISKRSG